MTYCHCVIEKKVQSGLLRRYSWIPKQYCTLNKSLVLKDDDDRTHGWVVVYVGDEINEVTLKYLHAAYKGHRIYSDV